jgi:2'-5' RNA ligase
MSGAYREQQRRVVDELRAGLGRRKARVSIVPMRSNYKIDAALCLTAVVLIPDALAQDIHRTLVAPLKRIEPDHHYYAPDSMHLTIKNVRVINDPPSFTETDVEKVNRLFAGLIPRHVPFSFSLEEVVAFATSVSLIGYCDGRLRDLVHALDRGLNEIGVPDDKHYVSDSVFFGNVTLCRYVRQPRKRFREAVERMARVYKSTLKVEVIHLITCNAVCAPKSRKILYAYRLRDRRSG